MKKSRILTYLLAACMTVSMPIQAFAFDGEINVQPVGVGETQNVEAQPVTAEETWPAVGEGSQGSEEAGETACEDAEAGKMTEELAVEDALVGDESADSDNQTASDGSGSDVIPEEKNYSSVEELREEVFGHPLEEAGDTPSSVSGNVYVAAVTDGTVEQQEIEPGCTIVKIPSEAKRIADQAFIGDNRHQGNRKIEGIIFENPQSVTAIGYRAFYNVRNLKGITITPNVKLIGEEAFRGCESLKTVSVNSVELILDSGAKNIFADCDINRIDWGYNLEMAPDYLFYGASFEPSFKLSFRYSRIDEVGTYTFFDSNLSDVDLEGITEIDPYAFAKAEKNEIDTLSEVTLPKDLMYLGECAFACNSGLKRVKIESRKIQSNAAGGAFYMCRIQSVEWPSNIKTIPGGLFKNAYFDTIEINGSDTSYLELKIPASVTEIGPYAFYMKDNRYDPYSIILEEGSSLRTIGDYAFCGRSFTTSINLQDAHCLKRIGAYAFFAVPLTGTLELDSIVSIGDSAFDTSGEPFNSVYLGPYLSKLGKEVFGTDAKRIKKVYIYSKILKSTTGDFVKSFAGCSGSSPEFNMNYEGSLWKAYESDKAKEEAQRSFSKQVKMVKGYSPREHTIKYELNGGKWGNYEGIGTYYEDFVYVFEEPILTGSKFYRWRLQTPVQNITAKDIADGVFVTRTEANWNVNIKISAEYDKSKPYFVEDIVLKGSVKNTLKPVTHGNNIVLSEETLKLKSVPDADKIITLTAFPYDEFGDLMNSKQLTLTWKSTDPSVAKLKKDNKDFTATFTLTGNTGAASIYVTAKGVDDTEISNLVTVSVRSLKPKLNYTALEINKYEEEIWMPFAELYDGSEIVKKDKKGNETTIMQDTYDKKSDTHNYKEYENLSIYQKDNKKGWYLKILDEDKYDKEITLKNLYIYTVTRYGTSYRDPILVGPFTLKITITEPGVTFSSSPIYKGNFFYTDMVKARVVYDITGSCDVIGVVATSPDGGGYCPWIAGLDVTHTSLILYPELIESYKWHDKATWNSFIDTIKKKVVLNIIGVNSNGNEFFLKKTITPTLPSIKKPKITLDEITVFSSDDIDKWTSKPYEMTARDEDGTIINNEGFDIEYPIFPSTTHVNNIYVHTFKDFDHTEAYLDLTGTPPSFKSGSVKVRLTNPLWTQPVDVTQKISSTKEDRPDSLLLSSNSLKMSYDTLECMAKKGEYVAVGVRYKGSSEVPDSSNVGFVPSGKAVPTPDDEAIGCESFTNGEIRIDCEGIKRIIDVNNWKKSHTFKFKYGVPNSKKTVSFSLAISRQTNTSFGVKGNINILNRGSSYVLLTPKITGTRKDVTVVSVDDVNPYFKINKDGDREYIEDSESSHEYFIARFRNSDNKILIYYDPEADLKPGAKKISLEMTLSDGTPMEANATIKLVQSQSGVQCEKAVTILRNAAGNAETPFIIKEKKGTIFSRTYEIDRSGLGIETMSFSPSKASRYGFADRITYDAIENKFILRGAYEDEKELENGTYKLKLWVHYKGEYIDYNKKNPKPLTTITLTVTVRDSGA